MFDTTPCARAKQKPRSRQGHFDEHIGNLGREKIKKTELYLLVGTRIIFHNSFAQIRIDKDTTFRCLNRINILCGIMPFLTIMKKPNLSWVKCQKVTVGVIHGDGLLFSGIRFLSLNCILLRSGTINLGDCLHIGLLWSGFYPGFSFFQGLFSSECIMAGLIIYLISPSSHLFGSKGRLAREPKKGIVLLSQRGQQLMLLSKIGLRINLECIPHFDQFFIIVVGPCSHGVVFWGIFSNWSGELKNVHWWGKRKSANLIKTITINKQSEKRVGSHETLRTFYMLGK